MTTTLSCPKGHTWQIDPAGNGATPACPICGAAPRAALQPSSMPTVPPRSPEPETVTARPNPADPQNAATIASSDGRTGSAELPAVPGYELLSVLGRGGMGVVYKARQVKLKRIVALKMILQGGHAGAAERVRFRVEAEAIARLQHPNIVQVFEVGDCDGLPFFSLEFCPGGNLARKLAGTPLPPSEAAALVETLARAMDAAHQQGIIHRDLKPANVLLTPNPKSETRNPKQIQNSKKAKSKPKEMVSEIRDADLGLVSDAGFRISDFAPKITDFGLAKQLDEAGQTATGAVMGTPSYMAPEQAGGKTKDLGPPCDIYALGAILYECLTGRPPFKAATPLDTILQVVNAEPVPMRQLNAGVPADMETICLKCLNKEPARRYATAADLAEELRRYQAGEPIQARSVGQFERVGKWVKRHPATAGLVATVVLGIAAVGLTLALGMAGSVYFAIAADAEAGKTREANAKLAQSVKDEREAAAGEKSAREETEDKLATSTMMLARSRFEEEQSSLAEILLAQVPPKFRSASWGLLKNYTAGSLFTLRRHTGGVKSVAFSVDGQVLASASEDSTVKLWDARTGQELRTLHGHTGIVWSVAFAADGQVLASASEDSAVKLWDARTGQELRTLRGHTGGVESVAFSADGQVLASASADKTVKLWDALTGKERCTLRGHSSVVTSVAFAADGQVLASASLDGTVKLWDALTGQELRTLRGQASYVKSVAFAADGQVLASASADDNTVKLWDARTGQELRTLRGHTAGVTNVAFAANAQVLASASNDKTVKLWDARTGQELRTLHGHTGIVWSVAFAADGLVLASASADGTVKLWDARAGQELRTLRGHTTTVASVAFAADARVLASASFDKTVRLWDVQTGKELRTLCGHKAPVINVAFAADGKTLWSRDQFGKLLAWAVATGKQKPDAPPMLFLPVGPGAWSPDGSMLAMGQFNGLIVLMPRAISDYERRFRLWVTAPDLHLHRELAEQADKDKEPFALAFRLGRYIAGKSYYAANPKDDVKPPFSEPTFPDGIACTGVLYKDSGIAPARLLIGTSRALKGDSANWLNHAFHGGALFRSGEHAKALAALTEAAKLRGKPSPLTHNLLALVSLKMGEKDKAQAYLKQAAPAKDAPWEDVYLQRLLQPEVEAALAKADGTVGTKE